MVSCLEQCEVNSLLLPPEGYALMSFRKIRVCCRAHQFGVRGCELEFGGKAPLGGPRSAQLGLLHFLKLGDLHLNLSYLALQHPVLLFLGFGLVLGLFQLSPQHIRRLLVIGQILIDCAFLSNDDALVIYAFLEPIMALVFLQSRYFALKLREL